MTGQSQKALMGLLLFFLAVNLFSTAMAQEQQYIHLPGKSCKDAPPCPDDRPCVMARPHCNVGTCPDLVPSCVVTN